MEHLILAFPQILTRTHLFNTNNYNHISKNYSTIYSLFLEIGSWVKGANNEEFAGCIKGWWKSVLYTKTHVKILNHYHHGNKTPLNSVINSCTARVLTHQSNSGPLVSIFDPSFCSVSSTVTSIWPLLAASQLSTLNQAWSPSVKGITLTGNSMKQIRALEEKQKKKGQALWACCFGIHDFPLVWLFLNFHPAFVSGILLIKSGSAQQDLCGNDRQTLLYNNNNGLYD